MAVSPLQLFHVTDTTPHSTHRRRRLQEVIWQALIPALPYLTNGLALDSKYRVQDGTAHMSM